MSAWDVSQNRMVRRTPLETELGQILGHLNRPRDRKLIARHLGWDGGPPCSLSEAGAAFQITRERARQVYAGALPLIRQPARTPALDAVLAFVRKRQQERVADVERRLREREFTSGMFSLHGVLTAARLLGRSPGFDLDQFGGVWFVGDVSEVGMAIRLTAAKLVEHHGVARVSVVTRTAAKGHSGRIKTGLVRGILETRSDLCWLDQPGEWFWLTSVSRNRLLTRVQKVLAVFSRIPLVKLHEAISRDYRPLRIPEAVLRSFCACLPWCRVNGDDLVVCGELNPDTILSGGEAVTCAILQQHGGAMDLSSLEECCYAAGVKKANLWRVLSFSPLIQRLDREVYGFILKTPPRTIGPKLTPQPCEGRS